MYTKYCIEIGTLLSALQKRSDFLFWRRLHKCTVRENGNAQVKVPPIHCGWDVLYVAQFVRCD